MTPTSVACEILSCELDCLARSKQHSALSATLACAWTDDDIHSIAGDDIDPADVRAAYIELARVALAAIDAADLDRECYWCEGDGSVGVHRCCVCRGAGVEP